MRNLRLLVVALAGCAAPLSTHRIDGEKTSSSQPSSTTSPRWQPGPKAQSALEALWASKPLTLSAQTLALASGGVTPTRYSIETLLFESSTQVDAAGATHMVSHSVWRILDSDPDQTLKFTWSPWHEERPTIRGRVVTSDGKAFVLDPATYVDGTVDVDGLKISDVKQVSIALPHAVLGSVVELEVTRKESRPLMKDGGAMGDLLLWRSSPMRRIRISVDAPDSAPLKVEAIGISKPAIKKEGGRQRFEVDVAQLDYSPYQKSFAQSRTEFPRLVWSTGSSWQTVATQYGELVAPAFQDVPNFSELDTTVPKDADAVGKVRAILSFINKRLRYTALQLGDGAIVPTPPSKTLSRGYGDCKDLSTFLVAALKHYGLSGEVALVSTGALTLESTPAMGGFDHMIVRVTLPDGSPLWVDATAPNFEPGVVPESVRNQRALIISKDTKTLVPTPTSQQTPAWTQEKVAYELSPFGPGKGRLNVAYRGAFAANGRSQSKSDCGETYARGVLEKRMELFFGSGTPKYSAQNCSLGPQPLTLIGEQVQVRALDTGSDDVSVSIPSNLVALLIDEDTLGAEPGSDQRSLEEKAESQRRFMEHWGRSIDEVKMTTAHFDEYITAERTYEIALPPHFTVSQLPAPKSIRMGPVQWTESYRVARPGMVEVRFTFDLGKVDWSPTDLKDFRAAYWERFSQPKPELKATFEVKQLLSERKPQEAMALMKKWLTQDPNDGHTRARYAQILLELGLGDVALEEAQKAVKAAPQVALTHIILGNIRCHDRFGGLYRPPFDRAGAMQSLRQAIAIDPRHTWATVTLATLLSMNEEGDFFSVWNKDVAESARLMQSLADNQELSTTDLDRLLTLYLHTRKEAEAKALLEKHEDLRNLEPTLHQALVTAVMYGLEGTLTKISHVQTDKQKFQRVIEAWASFATLGRYDDARALLERYKDASMVKELAALRSMTEGAKPSTLSNDYSTPERAARSLLSILATASTPLDAAKSLKSIASIQGQPFFTRSKEAFDAVSRPNAETRGQYEILMAHGECVTEGGEIVQVRCEVPENRQLSTWSWWEKEKGQWRLVSLGSPNHLVRLAKNSLERRQLKASQRWIDSLIGELARRNNAASAALLLKEFWSQADHNQIDNIRFAISLASVTYDDMILAAPADVIKDLSTLRSSVLAGAQRRRADSLLAYVYDRRRQYSDAVQTLKPLAESENEQTMWQVLAIYEARAGQKDSANGRVARALAKDASNVEWRQVKATLEIVTGQYGHAVATLTALQKEKGGAVNVNNNLVWAQLLSQQVNDETERMARQMVGGNQVSQGPLHTAAMVLVERGQLFDAATLAAKRLGYLKEELDDPQWLLRGKMYQRLGLSAEAKQAFSKMTQNDHELDELARRP